MAGSADRDMTLDLGVMSPSPTLGVEIAYSKVYLFILREKECMSGGWTERERERMGDSQAGSTLSALSPMQGLNSQIVEIMT